MNVTSVVGLDCCNCGVHHNKNKWKKSVNGILLPKLFRPTVRKNCSSDQEKNLKLEAEGREFAKILRSLEQFV